MSDSVTFKENHTQGWRLMAANREAGLFGSVGFSWISSGSAYRYNHHIKEVTVRLRVENPEGDARTLHEGVAGKARTKAEAVKVARAYVREHGLRQQLRAAVAPA